MKMEQTECSETLALKLQMQVNHPEESIHHTACSSIKKKCPIDVIRRLKETRTPVSTKPAFILLNDAVSISDYSIMWQIFSK
jgi:hypothetical protein